MIRAIIFFLKKDIVRIIAITFFMSAWTPFVRFEGLDAVEVILSKYILVYLGFWFLIVILIRTFWFLVVRKKDQPLQDGYNVFLESTKAFSLGNKNNK